MSANKTKKTKKKIKKEKNSTEKIQEELEIDTTPRI